MRRASVVLLLLIGCSPRAVTPPARTFVMQTPQLPAIGRQDLQLDVARIGTIWGPELVNGNGRLRHAVGDVVAVEADAGILHVTNAGGGGDRNAYTGRVGVVRTNVERSLAIGAGVGGGHAQAAGNWATVDVAAVLSGTRRYVRPLLGAAAGYARPFGSRTFEVTEPDGSATTLQLPRNPYAQATVGIELGPRETAVLIGATLTRLWRLDPDVVGDPEDPGDDVFFALGAGVRFHVE